MKPWMAKLYCMVRANGRKIIPARQKYHERIATMNAMDEEQAESYVARARMRSRLLMAQREAEIERHTAARESR